MPNIPPGINSNQTWAEEIVQELENAMPIAGSKEWDTKTAVKVITKELGFR